MNLRNTQQSEFPFDIVATPTTTWFKSYGSVGQAGQASGVMGLTYSQKEVAYCQLKFKTNEGKTVSVDLT